MFTRGVFRKGTGEEKITLLLFELLIVLLVFASWYLMAKDKDTLLSHTDLDRELTQHALEVLPHGVTAQPISIPSISPEPLFEGDSHG